MQNKITQYNFEGGMSNVPSDSICADGSVHAEWNLIFRNGEHNVVQDPKRLYNKKGNEPDSVHILFIHTFGAENKNAIGIREDITEKKSYLVYYDHTDTAIMTSDFFIDQREIKEENVIDCTSIGQTLILNLKFENPSYYSGLYYFLWVPDANSYKYKFLGNQLPKPYVKFALQSHQSIIVRDNGGSHQEAFTFTEILNEQHDVGDIINVDDGGVNIYRQNDCNNLVIGLYEKNKKQICQKKGFHSPFFIRYALELFNGQYARISSPILMLPSCTKNTFAELWDFIKMHTAFSYLFYKNKVGIEGWEDIIKGIAVFVTRQVDVYDTVVDQDRAYKFNDGNTFIDGVYRSSINESSILGSFDEYENDNGQLYRNNAIPKGMTKYSFFNVLKPKTSYEVINDLKSTSIFYKLFSIPLEATDKFEPTTKLIKTHDLENIETLPQLDHDDYYGNCPLSAKHLYMYNRRLHITGIERGFFGGSEQTCNLEFSLESEYKYFYVVYIKSKSGETIVKKEPFDSKQVSNLYFYYPDPRAFKVKICYTSSGNNYIIATLNLRQHELLNGAYYMADALPTSQPTMSSSTYTIVPEKNLSETLHNELWVSEVNNPFVFNASGVVTVGNGTIEGICANTTALSPGQFGYHPLICFTTDGLWTLKVATDGTYSNAEPLSRDYCNNPKSITPTDKFIFFTSERGLMRIDGSIITPVSLQLSGKSYYPEGDDARLFYEFDVEPINFNTFLKNCKIAYDYRDNLLWITNEEYPQCFIYSIDSGAICMKPLPYPAVTIVNDFPDNIIVCKQIVISSNNSKTEHFFSYSLINRDEINLDSRRYKGFIISRPIKVEDATSLKSLATHRFLFDIESNDISVRVYGSDDLKVWSRFRSFSGRGFKYYKYHIIFNNLISTDTFSGLIAEWKMKFQRKFR